jgi:hypothetical protein
MLIKSGVVVRRFGSNSSSKMLVQDCRPVLRGNIRDTLNPKVDGYSWNKRLSNVDFPLPEGPEMTMVLLSAAIR